MNAWRLGVRSALVSSLLSALASAASLPPHGPLRVLVVSDEVNPNRLSDADLTQPGDISKALNAADSGITLEGEAREVSSQCVDEGLAALNGAAPPHVVVYFAHRPALGCDQSDQQAALTTAFQAQLTRGGGIVVFHHGGYAWPGKEGILPLLGVNASSTLSWNTTVGQRVFNVAPGHFVTTNGVTYEGKAVLSGTGGVPSGTFDYFDNIPDERYPNTALLEQTGEARTLLFASDSGGTRVLGYALERPGWQGRVVFYQPAEYQPHALDDRQGPNFQILANAIVYSARQEGGSSGGAGGAGAGGAAPNGGGANLAGAEAHAGGAAGGSGAGASSGGAAGSAGGAINRAGASGDAGTTLGGAGQGGAADGAVNGAGAPSSSLGKLDEGGCGCRAVGAGATELGGGGWLLLAAWLRQRRRRAFPG